MVSHFRRRGMEMESSNCDWEEVHHSYLLDSVLINPTIYHVEDALETTKIEHLT